MHTETAHSHGARGGCGTLHAGSPSPLSLCSIMKAPQHPEESPSLSDPQTHCSLGSSQNPLRRGRHPYFDLGLWPGVEGGDLSVVSAQESN